MRKTLLSVVALALVAALASPAGATHRHYRHNGELVHEGDGRVVVINSLPDWVRNTSAFSEVIDHYRQNTGLTIATEMGANDATTRANCPTARGKIRVCAYGYNMAGGGFGRVWWDGAAHITRGRALLDTADAFYSDGYRDKWDLKYMICHELGHAGFALDHRGTAPRYRDAPGTCMSYAFMRNKVDGHDKASIRAANNHYHPQELDLSILGEMSLESEPTDREPNSPLDVDRSPWYLTSDGSGRLSWEADPRAARYHVYWTYDGVNWVYIGSTSQTSFDDSSFCVSGDQYRVWTEMTPEHAADAEVHYGNKTEDWSTPVQGC